MTVTEFILWAILLALAVIFIVYVAKRIRLMFSILSLGKIEGVSTQDLYPPAFFSPNVTKRPAVLVKVRDKCYAVRIFNGKNSFHAVHVANEKYASVFLKSAGAVKVRRLGRKVIRHVQDATVYFPRTVILPQNEQSECIPVLLFNPAPREVTYVTPEKTSIKAAFTGDKVNGNLIFTRSTFERFIDRDSRGFFDTKR